MKKTAYIVIAVAAAFIVPLTVMVTLNLPFWKLPLWGSEEPRWTVVGMAHERDHQLIEIYDRVTGVEFRNDFDKSKNRVLLPEEWNYDSQTGKLHLSVSEKGENPHRAFLSSSGVYVQGVVREPWRFFLRGFSGNEEELLVFWGRDRQAIWDEDFRYDPQSHILTLRGKENTPWVYLAYWDNERLWPFEWVYGGEEFDQVLTSTTDHPALALARSQWLSRIKNAVPPKERWDLQDWASSQPVVVRKPGIGYSEGSAAFRSEIRSLSPSEWLQSQKDILGDLRPLPTQWKGFELGVVEVHEKRLGEQIQRLVRLNYVQGRSRFEVWLGDGRGIQDRMKNPYTTPPYQQVVHKELLEIRFWDFWFSPIFSSPQLKSVTRYSWKEGPITVAVLVHDALVVPPQNPMEWALSLRQRSW